MEAGKAAPASVALVAMGASSATYFSRAAQAGGACRLWAETWAINSMGGVIQHDRLFQMDDLAIQDKRAEADPGGNIAGMLSWLREHPGFYTSKVYPGFPGAREYPLQDVIRGTGASYFNSTVAYAVAFAVYLGVKKIGLYGCDFTYPNLHMAEKGRGCVEFWLGMAAAKGIELEVAGESTLLDACVHPDERFYGYDAEHIKVKIEGGVPSVVREPRKQLPSVAEIEQRYKKIPDPPPDIPSAPGNPVEAAA